MGLIMGKYDARECMALLCVLASVVMSLFGHITENDIPPGIANFMVLFFSLVICSVCASTTIEYCARLKNIGEEGEYMKYEPRKPQKLGAERDGGRRDAEKALIKDIYTHCPECDGINFRPKSGCFMCDDCGYSPCS